MQASKKPVKAIKNNNLIDNKRDNQPAKGIITTSAIK